MIQLYPLNPTEAIFAPFHDTYLRPSIPVRFQSSNALGFHTKDSWDSLHLGWTGANVSEGRVVAVEMEVPLDFRLTGYDTFVFCLTIPETCAVQFSAQKRDGSWQQLGDAVPGESTRLEVHRQIPPAGATCLKIEFLTADAEAKLVKLIWFAVRNEELTQKLAQQGVTWSSEWTGHILPEFSPVTLIPKYGLLFDAVGLADLRRKITQPYWCQHFTQLEAAARRAMDRDPEKDLQISDYAPFTDERYVRLEERNRGALYYDGLRLGLVGLIKGDSAMLRHAARFLMTMLHLKHWSPSAETRMQGSTWDQRCFTEEMMTTSCALLMDWLDGLLTDRARELGQTMLWDRGMAVIERDMAKFSYVHSINQGPWFCRARILGGLVLEKAWPHFGEEYADRAVKHLRDGLDRYILPDGGMDEGPMYLLLTLEVTLPPLIAYARRRGVDVHSLLPRAFPQIPRYLRSLARSQPGLHIPNSDCASEHPFSDSYAILAGLSSDPVYASLAATSLLVDLPFTYQQHYVGTGIFSLIHGSEKIEEPRPILATCELLEATGIASSFRQEGQQSMGVALFGSKAFPSHSHFDRGSFTLELDGQMVFVDRGTVRYDDPRASVLNASRCHNVLVPSYDGRTTEEQNWAEVPVLIDIQADDRRLVAAIDLAAVWKDSMIACSRRLESASLDELWVKDQGELLRPGQVVFFLQSGIPFEPSGAGRWLCGPAAIEALWVERWEQDEYLIDSEFRPIFRLHLWSHPLRNFSLETKITRR